MRISRTNRFSGCCKDQALALTRYAYYFQGEIRQDYKTWQQTRNYKHDRVNLKQEPKRNSRAENTATEMKNSMDGL